MFTALVLVSWLLINPIVIGAENNSPALPVIDIAALRLIDKHDVQFCRKAKAISNQIGSACRVEGFFYVTNHGIPSDLIHNLDSLARDFFALNLEDKRTIAMKHGGMAWRGYFGVGDEVTSGIPDQKEGIYFGTECPLNYSDPKPLHGHNLWPPGPMGTEMESLVMRYLTEQRNLGQALMRAIACYLGVDDERFISQFSDNPTELFRIFNYPPHNSSAFGDKSLGVGEHTDYGYLTILNQDDSGGLQVKVTQSVTDESNKTNNSKVWVDAPPIPNTFVINLGDALEHATAGLLRATPHRVQQRRGAVQNRISMPYFFDPCFDCPMIRAAGALSLDPLPIVDPSTSGSATASCSNIKTHMSMSLEQQASGIARAEYGVCDTVTDEAANSLYQPSSALASVHTIRSNARKEVTDRWDGADPTHFRGTYGDYILRKVSKVFPALFREHMEQET